MDSVLEEFNRVVRFGTPTTFNSSLTLESLNEFMPAFPMGQAAQQATVMKNLQALATGDHVGTPQELQPRNLGNEVQESGLRFFANVAEKEAAEQYLQEQRRKEAIEKAEAEGAEPPVFEGTPEPIIRDAEEAIRKVVLSQSVQGQHEKMKTATDPIGMARLWHLRSETYSTKDINSFEKKLSSLLKGGAKKAPQPQKRA
jgi:uncharacterized protein with von Willebrand factor type A (vWA) domain